MKLGIDLSIMNELSLLKPVYKYQGKEVEPLNFFKEHSKISLMRLRIWVDPYDENANPYGGGTCDTKTVIDMAKKSKALGYDILLDFHYSDFFVDPARQLLPKAWRKYETLEEIKNALYEYTFDTLKAFKDEGIEVYAVQIGNEITHGMCWPFGDNEREYDEVKGGGFKGLCELLKSGIKASKEIYPNIKTVLHLEHSASYDMQDWYWTNVLNEGVDFDIMGESYYPYWHGPFTEFEDSISRLKAKYHKEIWVVELGYEFCAPNGEKDPPNIPGVKPDDFVIGNVNGRVPFEHTKEGQAEYLKTILKMFKKLGTRNQPDG